MTDKAKAYIVLASSVAAVITYIFDMHSASGVMMLLCGYTLGSISAGSQSANGKEG